MAPWPPFRVGIITLNVMPQNQMLPAVVAPTLQYEMSFLDMVREYEAVEPTNASIYLAAKDGFAAYVQDLKNQEFGHKLPAGWVPCSHRWLVQNRQVLGVVRVRHHINTAFLAAEAGHIGYDVRPSARRKGLGHCAMQAALAEARARGIKRALLCAGEANHGSRRIIEHAGGQLESTVFSTYWNEPLCRYWVLLAAEA